MARLIRPHIPLEVRCRVALRQLGWPAGSADQAIEQYRRAHKKLLGEMLTRLAMKLGCAVEQLHLDHDPALENREKVFAFLTSPNGLNGRHEQIGYTPDANDHRYLFYRVGGFRGSDHDIKTRVRGEHGQFADNVLAKRERKRKRKLTKQTRAHKWPKGRKLRSRNTFRRSK